MDNRIKVAPEIDKTTNDILQNDIKNRELAIMQLSLFMVNKSEVCFKKCMNFDIEVIQNKEIKCLDNCFNNDLKNSLNIQNKLFKTNSYLNYKSISNNYI